MRIVLIGQAAFGEKVLEALIKEGENIVGVFCPPDVPGRPNTLKELATKNGIPVFQPKKMKDKEAIDQVKKLDPELIVMAYVTDIVPKEILDYPKYGTIQYHPSLLPKHRGGSAINWAVIMGEKKTGLTIFWPDEGIDTGPILLQKEVEISDTDTTGSLYFNKLFPLGVEAMVEAVKLVKSGKAEKIPQNEEEATYEPLCTEEVAKIDWSKDAKEVYNLIRGCDPQPGANTKYNGETVYIYDCELKDEPKDETPGKIVALDDNGFLVAAKGGAIYVKRAKLGKGGKKLRGKDFIEQAKIEVGKRFS